MDKELGLSGWTKSVAKATKLNCLTAQPTAWELRTVLMLRMPVSDASRVMTNTVLSQQCPFVD